MRRWLVLLVVCFASAVLASGPVRAGDDADLAAAQRLAEAGDVKGALAAYEAATAARPADAQAHMRLGGMQLLDAQYAAAVQSFQRAVSLGEHSGRSFIGMGMAYLHTGQYAAARAALLEARQLNAAAGVDIDQLLAWLDTRDASNTTTAHSPVTEGAQTQD